MHISTKGNHVCSTDLKLSQCRCRFRASGMLYCIEVQIRSWCFGGCCTSLPVDM